MRGEWDRTVSASGGVVLLPRKDPSERKKDAKPPATEQDIALQLLGLLLDQLTTTGAEGMQFW